MTIFGVAMGACVDWAIGVRVSGMRWWLWCCLLLAGTGVGVASVLPERPPGRILDQARMFSSEPERLERLSKELEDVSVRSGHQLYVAIFDSLIGSDVEEQAFLLREKWLDREPGVVLVFESDSGRYVLDWVTAEGYRTEDGEWVPVVGEHDLLLRKQIQIRNQLRALGKGGATASDAVVTVVTTLAKGVDTAFQAETEPPKWKLHWLMLAAGLVAGMLLVGLLVGAWIRSSDRRSGERLYFPEVRVGMRLGAACGGGTVSQKSFSAESSA